MPAVVAQTSFIRGYLGYCLLALDRNCYTDADYMISEFTDSHKSRLYDYVTVRENGSTVCMPERGQDISATSLLQSLRQSCV
jgi:hypothetical protein